MPNVVFHLINTDSSSPAYSDNLFEAAGDMAWDELFSDPRSIGVLDELIAEVEALPENELWDLEDSGL